MTGSEEVDGLGRAEPIPLEKPFEVGLDPALDALDDVLAAFRAACRVLKGTGVLRLDKEADELSLLASGVGRIRDSVTETGEAIAAGHPIARSFRHGDLPWYEAGWGPRLTPRQFWALARRAGDVFPSELVIYAEVMRREYPSWVLEREKHAEARAEEAAARVREMKDRRRADARLLEEVESRPCPKCGAWAGEACITREGNPGGPHYTRKKLSPLQKNFRQELSELRRADFDAWFHGPGDGRETDRERLARFISRTADLLAPHSYDEANRRRL